MPSLLEDVVNHLPVSHLQKVNQSKCALRASRVQPVNEWPSEPSVSFTQLRYLFVHRCSSSNQFISADVGAAWYTSAHISYVCVSFVELPDLKLLYLGLDHVVDAAANSIRKAIQTLLNWRPDDTLNSRGMTTVHRVMRLWRMCTLVYI